MSNTQSQPILIIGAGPVGLTAALALSHYGLQVRIFDKQAGPSCHSKAMTVQPRTLELFHGLGAAPALIEPGLRISRANIYRGSRRLVQLNFDRLASPFPFTLQIPQSILETQLVQLLEARGVRVERQTTLTRLSQSAETVEVEFQQASGLKATAQTPYLLGCDGAHSTVRILLGIPFAGSSYRENFIMADVDIKDFPLAPGERHTFLGEGGYFVIIPFGRGNYRLVTMRPPENPLENHPPTLEEFEALRHRFRLPKMTFSNPHWLTQFYPHRRLAQRFQDGRVFLAGDAAHIHSPIGAQGMNTGIQDALNLAWKLALVASDQATPALLESYQTERQAVARAVLRRTDEMAQKITQSTRWGRFIEQGRWYLHRYPPLNRRQVTASAQLQVNYRAILKVEVERSPAEQQRLLFNDKLAVGDRAPDFTDPSAPHRQFFDTLNGPVYHALCFSGPRAAAEQKLRQLVEELGRLYPHLVRCHVILSRPLSLPGQLWPDPPGLIHRCYGVKQAAIYLVRPDAYIAWRGPLELRALTDYLGTVLKQKPVYEEENFLSVTNFSRGDQYVAISK